MNLALSPLCAACAAPAPRGWRRWYIVVYSRCMPYSLQGLLIQLSPTRCPFKQTNKLVYCFLASFFTLSLLCTAPSGWRRWYIVVYSRCMPYSLQGLLIQLEASIIIANKQQSVIIQWLYILCLVWKQGYINRYILFIDQVEAVIFLK